MFGMLFFALTWLAHLAATSLSPPVDDLEQLTWVRSLEWGYYKHPPLPTWLLWLPIKLFGWSAWTVYTMGAATTLVALGIFWRLVARLRGERHAFVALLAAACISYYNGRLNYYNHEVVLLLATAVSAALTWQAFETGRLRWWAALGLTVGLGALAKYQIVVTVSCVLVFAAHQRAWRDPRHRRGLLLGTLIALATFAPHIEWLRSHDFGPVGYAMHSSLAANLSVPARGLESAHWLVDQLFNRALPAWLLLACVGWLMRPQRRLPAQPVGLVLSVEDSKARALFLAFGGVPLLFMPAIGVIVGADLQLHWGTPFLLFATATVMELTPRVTWHRASPKAVIGPFIAMQLLLLTVSHMTSPRGLFVPRATDWRNMDSQSIADAVAAPARAALGSPIHIIDGPAQVAAAVSLHLREHPVVLIDGRQDRSPWVSAGLVAACGALELGAHPSLVGSVPVGPAMPGWWWRVRRPTAAETCPIGQVP